ncbi:lanthionine synthetase LanC family protein [Chitinophaga sp. S165]|uniref:lanthionine synthetase LanC family protein n=1 Tax=Chitinophaga sp. S165 TaxID=2135462 RepID=UPI000D70D440|nr:lanthionine synthetase LanC family protein [Chitinophaga sp. S165]PWV51817.1 lanthionine synthetase-like protein [Chitinophaga sp. S165]
MRTTATHIVEQVNGKIAAADLDEIIHTNGLFKGRLGLLVYYFYSYKFSPDQEFLDGMERMLAIIFDEINDGSEQFLRNASYADGLSGLGIVLTELINEGILDETYLMQLDDLDDVMYENCITFINHENFDFFHGAFGIIRYFEVRGKKDHLTRIIQLLSTKAYNKGTEADIFNNSVHDEYVTGCNFGIAHGIPGFLLILLNLYEQDIEKEYCKKLLEDGLDYLISFRNQANGISPLVNFPYNIYKETAGMRKVHVNTRLAYCNSDLGITFLLLRAAKTLDNNRYEDIALEIGNCCTQRTNFDLTGVEDYHFCHGAAGVAQLYTRIAGISGQSIFTDAYEHWINRTISSLEEDMQLEDISTVKLSFLHGWLGAVLAVYGYLKPELKAWDKFFLLS